MVHRRERVGSSGRQYLEEKTKKLRSLYAKQTDKEGGEKQLQHIA